MCKKHHKKWNQECKQKQSCILSFCNIFDLLTSKTRKIAWCPLVGVGMVGCPPLPALIVLVALANVQPSIISLFATLLIAKSLCLLFFYQIFIFSSNDRPSKTMKNVFYFIQKFFSFPRYSNFCNFFPSSPHFPDSKGQKEVE